jgi:hypothetical protein
MLFQKYNIAANNELLKSLYILEPNDAFDEGGATLFACMVLSSYM